MSENTFDRPNILWLTYEDTSPQFVSCYGMTPVPTTPTMDSLAADGVRFDNAFATAPVCSASRSALITGVCNEATGLGHHRSKYPIPRSLIRGFPSHLREAGYYTTNNVKTDYNIEDERSFIEATWDESSTKAHWRNRAPHRPFFSVFNFMDSHQSRTMTKPWGWYEEHVLGALPPDEVVEPDDLAMPPFYRDDAQMRRHLTRVYNSLRLCDMRIAERLAELDADGLREDTIIFCFADHGEGIPRGKFNGIGFGYRAAFVLSVPEKYAHLSPWGSGVVTDELVSFEDLAPTVLSLAGLTAPDHMTGRAIMGRYREDPPPAIFAARSRHDDTPDVCRSAMDGRFVYTRNFHPHLPVVKYQKYSDVSEILREIRRDYARGALNDVQAELVAPTRPREYLYDLSADPWEIRNLAHDPTYAADLSRLGTATVEHAIDVADVMFLPEREMIGELNGATPYERRTDTSYNPLPQLLEAAGLVGDPAAIPRQIELLEHEHYAVRYWAATGLYAAREALVGGGSPREGDNAVLAAGSDENGSPSAAADSDENGSPSAAADSRQGAATPRATDSSASVLDVLRKHLRDDRPCVHIELAAAMAYAFEDAEAERILAEHIESSDYLLSHQAISKVLYMPEIARKFADSVDRALDALGSADPNSPAFPPHQAAQMYRYLYADAPLYYEEDLAYVDAAETRKGWD